MREIKFRAWDKRSESMVSPDQVSDERIPVENTDVGFKLKTKFELMQFTGLKDKNGKEIYEGDILYMKEKNFRFNCEGRVLVCWNNCEFYAKKIDGEVREDDESLGNYNFKSSFDIEVIGNKFENPELLKTEET